MRFDSITMRMFCLTVALVAAMAVVAPAEAQSCGANQAWVPPGSGVTPEGPATLSIVPPAEFTYVGYNESMALLKAAAIKCSCDCTSTSGKCNPSVFNGNCNCTATDGCTACSMTVGSAVATDVFRFGGFAELSADVTFLSDPRAARPAAFSALFELPEVQTRLDAFLSQIPVVYSQPLPNTGAHFTVPQGWVGVPVAVAGRTAFVVVPTPWANAMGLAAAAAGGGSCSCTSGTCTYNSKWTPQGTLHYCEGNCSGTCTLSMNSVAAPGTTFEYSKSVY